MDVGGSAARRGVVDVVWTVDVARSTLFDARVAAWSLEVLRRMGEAAAPPTIGWPCLGEGQIAPGEVLCSTAVSGSRSTLFDVTILNARPAWVVEEIVVRAEGTRAARTGSARAGEAVAVCHGIRV